MADPVDRQLERVFRSLDERSLGAGGEGFTAADLALGPLGERTERLFGVYTATGLITALRAYGTLQRMEHRAGPLRLSLDLDDPYLPRLLAHADGSHEPVIDLTLSLRTAGSLGIVGRRAAATVLYLESIVLQLPAASFSWERPPLPHQRFPGISLSGEILQLLVLMARRLATEGLALTPKGAASAIIYARFFRYLDPTAQGRLGAIRAAARAHPFWFTAWAAELSCLCDASGAPLELPSSAMLVPLSGRLRASVTGAARRLEVFRAANVEVLVDRERLRARFPWELMPAGDPPPEVVALVGERPQSTIRG